MRTLSTITLVAFLAMQPNVTHADGLIYKLPQDGTSVELKVTGLVERDGKTEEMDGTIWVSSVGKKTVDGEVCRWIELKWAATQVKRDSTAVTKVLVPEKQLAAGKTPVSHVREVWYKMGDREAKEVTDLNGRRAGLLPAFLAGPFKDVTKVEAKTIDSGLGKLECKGVTGTVQFKQGSEDHKWTFTNWLNEKAPFGLVASEIKLSITESDGDVRLTSTMTLKAVKVGKDAVAEIPNTN
jgi:hypothetical protein